MEELGIGRSTVEHELGGAPCLAMTVKRIFALYLRLVRLNHAMQDVEQSKAERMAKPIWFWRQGGGATRGAVLGGALPKWRKRGGAQWRREGNGGGGERRASACRLGERRGSAYGPALVYGPPSGARGQLLVGHLPNPISKIFNFETEP
jgi:hypothetical protein